MFNNLCRFWIVFIVFRNNIIPGKLAKTAKTKPGSEHGEPVKGFCFVFKAWHEIMNHIKEDKPGFIMLGAFEGKTVASLLCQRFLGNVFREFKAFGFHANILHKGHVCSKVFCKDLFHFSDAFAHDVTKSFTTCHLMNDFKGIESVSKA